MRLMTNFINKFDLGLFSISNKYCILVKNENKQFFNSLLNYRKNVFEGKVQTIIYRKYSTQNETPETSKWSQPSGTNSGVCVYNCVAKKKVPLFLKNDIVTWYSCGPTVYDSAHIGHASCYVKLDIIQRILKNYFNLNLVTCMGVTDIDDKIIKKSVEIGVDMNDITKKYEAEFWKNLSDLHVMSPDIITRVTDHVPTIIDFIKKIMNKDLCYVTSDKSISFDTEKYGKYGKLQKAQHREDESNSISKKSSMDFTLWKSHKEGEPFWETEWGNGRPGWHIECSAMASRLFGSTVDIHAGGIDLQFPHHENEEAQSCAYHGSNQWVSYWIHTGHLHLKNDVKMSKSLKNTISIDEMLKNCNANVFRMACLMSQYRYSMEFGEDIVDNAKAVLLKIKQFLADSKLYINNASFQQIDDESNLLGMLKDTKTSIDMALRDDFDTPRCISLIIKLMGETNKITLAKNVDGFCPVAVGSISIYIVKLMQVFGIDLDKQKVSTENSDLIEAAVNFRKYVRMHALKTKDKDLLKQCDILRNTYALNKIKINDKSDDEASWIFKE